MTFRKAGFEPAVQFAEIEQFGFRHMIRRRLVNRMLTVAEELCIQTLLPMLMDGDELRLVFEYSDSDGGSVNMEVTYPGADRNPLEVGDGLSLALTRHACEEIAWQHQDGTCRIRGKLVQT